MGLIDVQTRLKAAGLYSGSLDGKYGKGTESGVMAAFDRAGLPPLAAPVTPKTPMVVNPTVQHPQYTIEQFIQFFIQTYEGGLSMDPKDAGNTYRGVLIGSKYGVTGAALADYRNTVTISKADIANLTLAEAVQVGLELYYDRPDFDLLPWDPVIASVMDMGFNAGPGQSIRLFQRMCAVGDDGKIGRFTIEGYEDYVLDKGLEQTAKNWCAVRYAYYDLIIKRKPTNAKYRNGWRNRAAGFLPGTPWWAKWGIPASNR
jgi:lysozyme family protein